jgi:hypothetical protein
MNSTHSLSSLIDCTSTASALATPRAAATHTRARACLRLGGAERQLAARRFLALFRGGGGRLALHRKHVLGAKHLNHWVSG